MTHLKTVGNYTIESQKRNRVSPDWCDQLVLFSTIVGALVFAYIYYMIEGVSPQFVFVSLFGIVLILASISVTLILFFTGCGIEVRLLDSCEHGRIISSTSFKISKDPEADATILKEIVDKYEKEANDRIKSKEERENSKKLKEKECCDAYRKVIEKIK